MNSERPKQARPKNPASNRLALARDFIQRNRRRDSLAVLDAHLNAASGVPSNPLQESKVAALLGDYERKRGHFSEAADYYAVASGKLPADETRNWFRPALGQVRALIAQPAVDEAFTLAQGVWTRAKATATEFDETTASALVTLKKKGRVEIAPRPLRPSVVATRLGEAFLQAGEWEMAEFFFKEVMLINPNGGSRARQALSKIALASNRHGEVESRARESLLLGKFRAKTLSAWPLLITGRARQGKPLLTPEDRAALRLITPFSVRARAVLVVCKAIRPHNDTWMDLAADWSKKEGIRFPAIRFELEKMLRSEARLAGVVTRDQAAIALQHARSKEAAPSEAIAAGKAYVRTLLLTGAKKVQWDLVSNHLARRYGKGVANRAIHAMALGAMDANRYDVARTMLVQIRTSVPPTRVQWMRSTWALARMEAVLKDHAAEYATYSEMAQNAAVPPRFRAQALLRALKCAESAKLTVEPADVSWLEVVIEKESDHRVLLDLGRQLGLAGRAFQKLRDKAADKATELANAKLTSLQHPAGALALLLELNRRQYYDFARSTEVVTQFESYAAPRLDWLWSTSSAFWEWYGIVVLSIGRARGLNQGVEAADRYLKDPGTPQEGIAMLAVKTGNMLMAGAQRAQAMPYFARAIQASPDSMTVGAAYYWSMIALWASGKKDEAKVQAGQVKRCYGFRPALAEEWRYDSQASLILKDKNVDAAFTDLGNTYEREYLAAQLEKLDLILAKFLA